MARNVASAPYTMRADSPVHVAAGAAACRWLVQVRLRMQGNVRPSTDWILGAEPDFLAGADAGYFIRLVHEEPRGWPAWCHITLVTKDLDGWDRDLLTCSDSLPWSLSGRYPPRFLWHTAMGLLRVEYVVLDLPLLDLTRGVVWMHPDV